MQQLARRRRKLRTATAFGVAQAADAQEDSAEPRVYLPSGDMNLSDGPASGRGFVMQTCAGQRSMPVPSNLMKNDVQQPNPAALLDWRPERIHAPDPVSPNRRSAGSVAHPA